MRKVIFAILAMPLLLSVNAMADQYVRGYTKSNGTYVQPHYRSSPNSTKLDNYSTQGNTNPYIGERGTQRGDTYDTKPFGFDSDKSDN